MTDRRRSRWSHPVLHVRGREPAATARRSICAVPAVDAKKKAASIGATGARADRHASGPRRSPLTAIRILLAAVLLPAGLACNLLGYGKEPTATLEPEFEGYSLEEALAVEPEDRRETVLELMGPPDAFRITFQELEGSVVRMEEWSYFDALTRFDFIDGELLWTVELEPVPDGTLYAHRYDPRNFTAYMSTSQVTALLEDQELERVDLTEADIEAGLIMAGDQILLGFDDDRLVYVQTFILIPEAGQDAAQAQATAIVAASPPTPSATATHPGPPTNTPRPGDPLPRARGELIFADSFDSPEGGAVPLFGPESMTLAYEAGQGGMTGIFQGGVLAAMYDQPVIADFIAELEIRAENLDPGSRVGLIFRSDDAQGGLERYYNLALGPGDATLAIDAWKQGQWVLQRQTPVSPALLPPSGTHRLRLEVEGSRFRVFLNGTFVLEVVDTSLPEAGILGLSLVSAAPPETVTFDNLRVYALP